MPVDANEMITALRVAGGDVTSIEVKSAQGGLPQSLTSTLSALANLPGGGTIILGLDEQAGFRPVPLADPQIIKQGLASKARSYNPPIRLTIEDGVADGQPVIIATVHECDPSAKPCRVAATGVAYLRGYDGDFALSELEQQAFLAARQPPMFDRAPVSDATRDDLDPELLTGYADSVAGRDPQGLGRFAGDELLRRSGITTAEGVPTVAGLLALGKYPQEWFPRFVIQASAEPITSDPPGSRARNQMTIAGPIPRMLDEALAWARRTFDTVIVSAPDGTVRDQPAYPMLAFRELIANALVHRDLDHWSAGMAIEVRLRSDRLVVSNPGGLYGITVDRLGWDAVTSARNARLVAICQHVRTPDGGRVIEALATGLPIVTRALADAGLPRPHFIDAGIRFTVVLHRTSRAASVSGSRSGRRTRSASGSASGSRERSVAGSRSLNASEQAVYEALGTASRSAADLHQALGLSTPNIRKALRKLREIDLVQQIGGRGRPTTYRRLAS